LFFYGTLCMCRCVRRLREDYEAAVNGIRSRLVRYSEPSKLAYVGSYNSFTSTKSVRNEMVRIILCIFTMFSML